MNIPLQIGREWILLVSTTTMALFLLFGDAWLSDLSNGAWLALILTWLFGAIMLCAFPPVPMTEKQTINKDDD